MFAGMFALKFNLDELDPSTAQFLVEAHESGLTDATWVLYLEKGHQMRAYFSVKCEEFSRPCEGIICLLLSHEGGPVSSLDD